MTATEFRALLKARNHSSFSAAPLIGTSPAHIRSWASGRQNIPTKYLPAIEKLPDRPPGKRWSPAEIGRPAEAKPAPDPGSSLPRVTTPALGRRKRRRERPLPVFDPVAYDKRHPIRPVKDGPAPTILDLVAYVARALPEPWRPADDPSLIAPVSLHGAGIEGEILPPIPSTQLPAIISPTQRPAAVPRSIALPPGVTVPYPDFWRGDLPGPLYGVICAAAVTIREDGGAFVAGHCGRRVHPNWHLCIGHLRIETASHGVAPMPQSRPLGPATMRTRPRPPSYS
jgi:hypothetical protein